MSTPYADEFGTVHGLKPMTDEHGHTWQVVWDGWAVGFRVTHPDPDIPPEIICLNPSGESDDGKANAFVYIGAPADGEVITSITPFENPGTFEQEPEQDPPDDVYQWFAGGSVCPADRTTEGGSPPDA